jgi:hypothetical protein
MSNDSVLNNINGALVDHYIAIGMNLPTAYEAVSFDPQEGFYARTYNLNAQRMTISLGDGGMDEYSGVFQVDIVAPVDSGIKAIYDYVQQVLDAFKAGIALTKNGQTVYVRRSSPSSVRTSEATAGYVCSVSVYWYSRTQR